MKKTIVLIGLLSITCLSTLWARDLSTPITIKAIQDKQPAVTFPHDTHMTALKGKCTDCHITASGGAIKPKMLDAKDKGKMDNAYHTQCLECHKKVKGPTTCTACHKK